MNDDVKPRRRYHSPRRREAAETTRQRILDSARRLFLQHGYASTTIDAIARDAGVAGPTVYATFGSKRSILQTLVDTLISTERPPMEPMLEEPDPRRQVRMGAARVREIGDRAWDVMEIQRAASDGDPEVAADWRQGEQDHLWAVTVVVQSLQEKGALRPGIDTPTAADIFWALTSPEMYRRLVIERGWPSERFEEWVAETYCRAVLKDPGMD